MRDRFESIARGTLKATGLAIVMVAGAAGLAGQEVTGTWVLSVDLGATGSGNATFVFEQDGEKLTGTYSGALGEHRVRGSVHGDQIEFHFETDEVGLVSYSGTVTGSEVEGTCEYGDLASGTFRGRKQP